jgi:hypothetical protein
LIDTFLAIALLHGYMINKVLQDRRTVQLLQTLPTSGIGKDIVIMPEIYSGQVPFTSRNVSIFANIP